MDVKVPVHLTVERTGEGFDAMARHIEANTSRICQRLSQMIVRIARSRAPIGNRTYVDGDGNPHPGWLKSSIRALRIQYGHWVVKVLAHYAGFVEHGTRYMRAQPYLQPAVREAKRYFRQNWGAIFKKNPAEWAGEPA